MEVKNWDTSGLANNDPSKKQDPSELGPRRIGKNGTPPNYDFFGLVKNDPSVLAKTGPLRIEIPPYWQNMTLPDWQNLTLPYWQK